MRFRIAAQLGVVLVVLGFLAAGTTGGFVYSISRDLLIRSAKEKLLTLTQDLSRRMVASRQEVIYDLQILSEHPDTLALLAQRTPPQDAEKRLTGLFSQIMEAHPAYHRIQLISARNFGLEQIRVERRHLRVVSTRPEELQEKGHYAYVSEALKQPPRAAYMSRITARPEPALDAEDRPTTQLSMPVYFSGHAFARGTIVITLDIQHEFSRLSENTPHGLDLFLANGHGDILIHPDPSRTFGFDQGRRAMIQTEFPPVSALLDGRQQQVLFDTDASAKGTGAGASKNEARVAAFVRQGIEIASGDNWLYVGLSQPLATVLEDARQLEQSILRSLALVLPACLIVAILLARIVCRPINRLREAVQRFTKGESLGGLPIRRQDELGDLARSFKQMQDTITEQLGALQQNKNELEELIRHDPLTGLPNRRMLNERLDHAIALTQRGHYGVALLFIDLDGFKDINDTLGHDAGDIVLVSVARRLLEKVRVTDTVARLGGDEFVILLVGAPHHEAIASIAASVVTSIGDPIPVGERSLAVGASIGIALFPDDGKTASELLVAADHAMYRVKRSGRPGYTFANDTTPLRFE